MVAGPIRTSSLSHAHTPPPYLPLSQAVHSKKAKSAATKGWPLLRFRDMLVPLYLILQCTNHEQRVAILNGVVGDSQLPKKTSVNDTQKLFAEFVMSGQLEALLAEDTDKMLTWKDAYARLVLFSSWFLLYLF